MTAPKSVKNTSSLNLILLLGVLLSSIAYFPLNRMAQHGHVLTTSLDKHTPFVPIFVIPYMLFLPAFWLMIGYAFISKRLFVKLAVSAIVMYVCSDIVYICFQTLMPRPQLIGHGLPTRLVRLIYSHDRPFNDLPSGHAAAATLFGLYFLAIKHRWRVPLAVFSLTVIAATVYIKQHSVIGALGGVLLASASWMGVSYVLGRREC